MRENLDLVIFMTGIGIILLVNVFSPYVWLARGFVLITLSCMGVFLPASLYLWPAFLSIPADLMLVSGSPHSGDLLIWASFVMVSYFSREYLSLESEENIPETTRNPQTANQSDNDSQYDEFNFESSRTRHESSENPEDIVKDLLIENLRWAQHHFEFDNLIYFHVRDEEAKPQYVINNTGKIRKDSRIGPDVGQGVGWILRQRKELILKGNQVDWRSLQYHAQPVQMDYVWMKPVIDEDDVVGVLVVEWDDKPEVDDDELDDFHRKVQKMIRLGNAITSYDQESKRLRLVEQVLEVDPIGQDNRSQLIGRFKELIRQFLPSDHVEFLEGSPGSGSDTVVDKRKVFHKKCYEFVEREQKIIRSSSASTAQLAEKKLERFIPPEVNSFLAGPVLHNEELLGIVVLDHEDEDYYKEDDEELLEILLNRLSHLLKTWEVYNSSQNERKYMRQWLRGLSSAMETDVSTTESILKLLVSSFPGDAAGLYWRRNGQYQLLESQGPSEIPETVDERSSFIDRIRSGSDKGPLTFPDLGQFEEMDSPGIQQQGRVIPIGDHPDGFIVMVGDSGGKLDWSVLKDSSVLLEKVIVSSVSELSSVKSSAKSGRQRKVDS